MSPPGQNVSNMLPGKVGEQLAIAPERMKHLGQSGNDAQLWMCQFSWDQNWDQISNIRWIIEKAREFQKNIYFRFIDYVEALDCVDHNKLENS